MHSTETAATAVSGWVCRKASSASLILLAVLTIAWAAPKACCGDEDEDKAAAKIEALGGIADRSDATGRVARIILNGITKKLTDADMEGVDFGSFKHLKFLGLTAPDLTDRSMSQLEKCTSKLSGLWLTCTDKVTDAGLAKLLEKQESLWLLRVGGPAVGDESLAAIGSISDLRMLLINYAKISDKGAVHLGSLRGLSMLSLVGTKISDAGLKELATCDKLRQLSILDSDISKESVAALQKDLPKLKIVLEKELPIAELIERVRKH